MNQSRLKCFFLLLHTSFLMLTIAFVASCNKGKLESDTNAVAVTPKKLVVVQPVPVGVIRNYFSVPGKLEPIISVTLSAQVGGQVMQVPVNEGDSVATGQTLALVDDREHKAQYNQLNAQYVAQQANLAKLKQVTRPQEIKLLQAQVDSAKVALDNANAELERLNILFDAGVISLSHLEKARLTKESAQAAYTTISEQLSLALEGTREEDLIAAEAAVKAIEAQIEQVLVLIDKCQIKAPIAGIISKVYVEPSESVNIGSPVCGLVNLTQLIMQIGLAESDLISVKLGSTVAVRLKLAPEQPLPGMVTAIAPSADKEKGTFQVEITVPNPGGQILGGFYADVEFTRALAEKALIIPIDALINEGEKWYVFIVSAGRAEKREVLPGIMTQTHAQILKGVIPNELIVVVGQRLLQDEDLVDVAETRDPSLPDENRILAEMEAQRKQLESAAPSDDDQSSDLKKSNLAPSKTNTESTKDEGFREKSSDKEKTENGGATS